MTYRRIYTRAIHLIMWFDIHTINADTEAKNTAFMIILKQRSGQTVSVTSHLAAVFLSRLTGQLVASTFLQISKHP